MLGVYLKGFQSASLIKEIAFRFMFKNLKKDCVPELFQITELSEDGSSCFYLDSYEYSIFPKEQEILICTGVKFNVMGV